jgi:phosphoglycolate phosphatase
MLKLIVFDWDGTLADSVNKIIACKEFLARKYNLPVPSEKTIRNVLGIKFELAMATCFPTAPPDLLFKLGKEFNILMQEKAYQANLFPYAKEILHLLKEQKYKIAIATSKAKVELTTALAHNGLEDFFDAVCCSEEYDGKPVPTMLNHLMKVFKVQPEECLMLGDTSIDIMFAQNAGIKTVCVTFGAHSVEKLKAMNPLALIEDWRELPATLEKIRDKQCYQESRQYCRL